MRKVLIALGALVGLLLIAAVAIALFVDADTFRPQIQEQASQALGRQVTIGKLKLALVSGGITAEDLAIADDPKFSSSPFLTAKSMSIGVEMMPLILHKQLNVRSFHIHSPKLNLIESRDGKWNMSTLAKPSSGAKEPTTQAGTPITIGEFLLDNGEVTVSHLSGSKSSVYSRLRFEASQVSMTSVFPFKASATPPGGGTFKAEGTLGPLADQSEQTPVTVKLTVRDFDLAATGFTDPSSPLRGIVDLDGKLLSNGKRAQVEAEITGKKLCLVQGCSPASVPVVINLKTSYELAQQLADLQSGALRIGNSSAGMAGTIDLKGEKAKVNMRINAASLAVADVEKILPAVGVVLPSGARLEGGTASLSATSSGEVDKLVTTGRVRVLNTKLTGYDLTGKLAAVTKLMGVANTKETLIQEFSSDVQLTPAGTKADNLLLAVPAIGRLTGGGTIGAKNDLNFAMKAQVDIGKSPIGIVTAALGRQNTKVGVPFHITGTTSNPVFTPDMRQVVGSAFGGEKQSPADTGKSLLKGLGGLFGK